MEINNTTKKKVNLKAIERLAEGFLSSHRLSGRQVSVALVGSKAMRTLNRRYRRLDKTTDVLSFPGSRWPGRDKYLGEVVINLDEVAKANKYRVLFGRREKTGYILEFILVHGLLHLVGYHDDDEKKRQEMVSLGRKFLSRFRCEI